MGILKQKNPPRPARQGQDPISLLAEHAAVPGLLLFAGARGQPAARLREHRGSARAPRERGQRRASWDAAGGESRHISPSASDAKHCCSIHDQKEILNLPKTLWRWARRWGQDDPRMLKAEKQLTTNRLRCGSEISNEK